MSLSRVFALMALSAFVGFPLFAEDPPAEKPADKPAEEAAAEEKPNYEIPDGTPEELSAGIAELRVKEKLAMRQRKIADITAIQDAIVSAADRILDNAEADEQLAAKALGEKLLALGLRARLQRGDARTQLAAAIKKALEDKRDKVAAEARYADARQQLDDLQNLTPEQRDTLFAQVMSHLSTEKTPREAFSAAMEIARRFEAVDSALAARAYRQLAGMLAKSDDERLREYAPKLEGSARRVELPGSFMQIEGVTVDGKPFDWAAYRGKVVLIDFWATWCGPCIAELPNVKKNYELYHDKGFDVVGISLDEDRGQLEEFLKEKEIPWVTLFSDDASATGWNHPMASHYGIMAIPAVVLVDQEGKVVNLRARGPALGEELAKLLGPPPSEPTDETGEGEEKKEADSKDSADKAAAEKAAADAKDAR